MESESFLIHQREKFREHKNFKKSDEILKLERQVQSTRKKKNTVIAKQKFEKR